MPALSFIRDIETRATIELKKVGADKYAHHPDTDILCVAYAIDGEPAQIWRPGQPVPRDVLKIARDPDCPAIAHNAPFEMKIERAILGPRYGWPVIPIERNVCTMAMASALALPASLDKLTKALNLEHQKDAVGNRVMLKMTKPRKAHKAEDPTQVYWYDDAKRREQLEAYACKDVEAAREIAETLPWLSAEEHAIWVLDQTINNRGFYVDEELAAAACEIARQAKIYIDHEITRLTNGQVTSFTQVARITPWLKQYCNIKSLNKKDILDLLEDQIPLYARNVLLLRQLGAQAAVAKAVAILKHRESDGRVRGAFSYHAAGTGRWSSHGVQVHNLKRPDTEDLETAISIIRQADFQFARKTYENPLAVIGDLVRSMITAAPEHALIGGDFSGIEARVTAYLAGETSKLNMFRAYDAKEGPDPYVVAAARIKNIDPLQLALDYKAGKPDARELRQCGKAAELAFGFGGTVGAYRKFASDATLSNDEIRKINNAWRKAHPNIVQFWSDLESAAWKAVKHVGRTYCVRDIIFFCFDGAVLWMTLPSGRRLAYPGARIASVYVPKGTKVIVETEWGDSTLLFKDNSSGQWRDVRAWSGTFCENVVSAVARDLLATAMVRLDAAGFALVAHVHDEAVAEIRKTNLESAKAKFTKLMMQVPVWAEGLPIAVNTWISERYVK